MNRTKISFRNDMDLKRFDMSKSELRRDMKKIHREKKEYLLEEKDVDYRL